jgi:hypothetical protein
MGEIKSTLDLVMEKTKNLRFSDEEKQQNKSIDINKKIRGLVGKYKDGTLRYSELEKEINRLEKQHGIDARAILAEEVLQRIEFMADDSPLFEILKDFCGMESEPVKSFINAYREKALAEADRRRHAILGALKKDHHISGSAVAANLEKDEPLKAALKALQAEFKNRLTSQKNFPRA